MAWIWAVVFITTLIIEIVTIELASIWFTLGSLVAFILALCGVGQTTQIVVFLVVSSLSLLCLRTVCLKFLKNNKETTNLDSVVGTIQTLKKAVSEEDAGEIKLNGVVWRVVSKNNEVLEAGEKVKIVEVQGNKFIVEKEKNNG